MSECDQNKESSIESAKLAEQAERYDDMVKEMNKVAKLGIALKPEERNLLSVAYKNVVGTRRSSWRVIYSIHQREEYNEKKKEIAQTYLTNISAEIGKICEDVVELIDSHLLKADDDVDSQTFYMKMKGDYYRYVAEVVTEDVKGGFADKADSAYSQAYDLCKKEMQPFHAIRLGLALNYSVFYYEIKGEHIKASEIAQDAYDQAIAEINSSEEHHHKDSSLIMQLLRDNLTLWTAKDVDDDIDDVPAE